MTAISKLLKVPNLEFNRHYRALPAQPADLRLGVPKVYEAINCRGKARPRLLKFMLVKYNGPNALKLAVPGTRMSISFEPGAVAADEHQCLKFVSAGRYQEYFVPDNIQDVYEKSPPVITLVYYSNRYTIRFRRVWVKHDKHWESYSL